MAEIHIANITPGTWWMTFFRPEEVACKGTGLILLTYDSVSALRSLDLFREKVGISFSPNSAYRSEEHNTAIGGSKNSQHLRGCAFDIPIKPGMSRDVIKKEAAKVGFTGFGDYDSFVHIDTGPERHWDNRT